MRIRNFFVALLLLASSAMQAQVEMPALPVDTAVRIGKLDNGLTYYIRYNNWPENRANFYIAQKVGSLQEEDSQRGLAHFLEHMCFNGTDNFPDNEVIEYCRSIGVEFGRDLNAYTSIEETVYNINNVPTMRQASLDSCLLILHDWADGLLLEPEEIDKERGVIHEEWRLRTSATSRMIERNLPALYPGSKYGYRYPIGTMEVVDNFKPQELRDYYEKWYHPTNQGIIVVGNVNVDYTEAKIREMFGEITNPEDASPIQKVDVPDNFEPIVIIDKDKEMRVGYLDIMMKHETFPDSLKNTIGYIVYGYLVDAATDMLNSRYTEAALDPQCPYVTAMSDDGMYLLSKSVDAFDIGIYPKDQSVAAQALKAAVVDARRAAEFGFTPTEYARYKDKFLSTLDKQYSNKDKRTNEQLYSQCKDHFLNGEPLPSIDYEYQIYTQLVPMIPLEAVNEMMKQLVIESDTNVVILNFNIDSEEAIIPTKESLLSALHEANAMEIEPFVDNVKDEPLIPSLPTPGAIIKEENNNKFGYTELSLSNGVKVVLKKTDFKKDEVRLSGIGGAGSTSYPADDVNLKVFDNVISYSGLGNFSLNELDKALAGKIANADLSMKERTMAIDGSSTPKDVETMLQMSYLYFTAINKDSASFRNLMSQLETQLKNRNANPDVAFSDSLMATLYSHNPRRRPLLAEDLVAVSYDRILQKAKERTASANGWEFTIVGNYDEETIRPLLCQYLGALPSTDVEKSSPRETFFAKGEVENIFTRAQETPKATAIMLWSNDALSYSYEREVQLDMVAQILTMEYLKKIREDASAAYSCGAYAQTLLARDGYCNFMIQAYCPMKPEKKDLALEIMTSEMLATMQSLDAEKLQKVKEAMLKRYDDSQNENRYWEDVLEKWRIHNIDIQTDAKTIIESQTVDSLCAFMKEFLTPGNHITVAMLPEE